MKTAREVLINTNGTLLMDYKEKWIDSLKKDKVVLEIEPIEHCSLILGSFFGIIK